MGIIIAAGVVVIIVAAIAVVLVATRRRPGRDASTDAEVAGSSRLADAPPMTGLESALSQVTDRSGRPIREAIDAEAGHVDDFRVPDDTGPILRRALDHVSPPVDESTRAADADRGALPDTPPSGGDDADS